MIFPNPLKKEGNEFVFMGTTDSESQSLFLSVGGLCIAQPELLGEGWTVDNNTAVR